MKHRTKNIVYLRIAMLAALGFIGSCSPQSEPLSALGEKLVGDWQHKHNLPQNTVSWFRFNRDGSYATGSFIDLDAATAAAVKKKVEATGSDTPSMTFDGNRGHFVGSKGRWKLDGDILTLEYTADNGKDFVDTYQVLKCDETSLEMEAAKVKAAGLDGMQRYRREALGSVR